MTSRKDKILYWVLTAPFCLIMLLSGIFYFSGSEQVADGFKHLGLPSYMLIVLGTAKILGAIAILYGRIALLKEWAYAGFSFILLGASSAHAFSGDDFIKSFMPLVFLAVLMGSYFLSKKTSTQLIERRA